MLQLALRGVRYNVGRYLATIVAIVTGISFFAATGFFSQRIIDALEGDAVRQYAGIDAAIVADTDTDVDNAGFASSLKIPGELADQVTSTAGVAGSGGVLTGAVSFLGNDGKPFAAGATGRLWIDDRELEPLDIVDGAAPATAGEVAVDRGIAGDHDLTVGEQVTVLSVAGQQRAAIVGITSFGDADAIDPGGTVSISRADAFDWLSSGTVEYSELYLRGAGTQQDLVDSVQLLVPSGFTAQTGEEFTRERRSQAGGFGRFLRTALQVFAGIALFVGAFVIYNTFNVIVAQRQRELAVLAAIGATPKQVKRSLAIEGLLIGVIGSIAGVIAGLGIAFLIGVILDAIGVSLPGTGIAVVPEVIVQAVVIGTLVTYLSVSIPARRAARTEPIEAIRQAAVESAPYGRARTITSLALTTFGITGIMVGPWIAVGLGALALFVGVIHAGPIVAVLGAKLSRPLLRRVGLEGRLAADNAARNPKRTAVTANALLIGVFLVTFVTIAGTSVKDFAVAEIGRLSSADFVVASTGGTIDDDLVASLETVPGVQAVAPFQRQAITINGLPAAISTGDLSTLDAIAKLDTVHGSLDHLADGHIAVLDFQDTPVGSSVTITKADGTTTELTVAAVLENSIDSVQMGSIVTPTTFSTIGVSEAPTVAFIDAAPGEQTQTEDRIKQLTDLRPHITLVAGNWIGELVGRIFDFLINAVNALLLISVVVAVIGIINTLSLSILERRRELGLLRVIGMVDRRVQRMVRLESVLISALGTTTGLLLGAIVGAGLIAAIDRHSDTGINLSIPWSTLGIILLVGLLLGLAASLIPAHRSTRLDVLDAIQTT